MGTKAMLSIRHKPQTHNLGDGSTNPEKWDVILGGIKLVGSFRSKEPAERLRDSYNEHDTLKAKAELLDVAIDTLKDTKKRLIRNSMATDEITLILSRAKELSK